MTPKTANEYSAFIDAMNNAGKELDTSHHYYPSGRKKWKYMDNKERIADCTRQSRKTILRKGIDGKVVRKARYCHICSGCLEAEAEKRMSTFEKAEMKAKENNPNGEWRAQTFDDTEEGKKEAAAFKKKLSRNNGSTYMQTASVDDPTKTVVYTWTDDESLGEKSNPWHDIDWNDLYQQNKENGNKITYGKGLKLSASGTGEEKSNEEKISIALPEVLIDGKDVNKAAKILENTNVLILAFDPKDIQQSIFKQYKLGIEALEAEGINTDVKSTFYINIEPSRLIETWNTAVSNKMSILDAMIKEDSIASKMDISGFWVETESALMLGYDEVKATGVNILPL